MASLHPQQRRQEALMHACRSDREARAGNGAYEKYICIRHLFSVRQIQTL